MPRQGDQAERCGERPGAELEEGRAVEGEEPSAAPGEEPRKM